MQKRPLGTTGLDVSVIGLGTMTWGEQNSEAEAHAQLDLALDRGVNLVDAAEMYPVPPKAETQGLTETYLGSWLAKSGRRDEVVLATKCVGPGNMGWIRDGKTHFTAEHLVAACESSLRRLQTDHIDLYQLHWPDRHTNFFGRRGFTAGDDGGGAPIEETLRALNSLVQSGKIRWVGLSNETPWGVMRFLHLAERHGLPRVVSVQNPYNLLNRTYEIGLAEVSLRERCGLLAYSPLAMGALSGKYEGGAVMPEGSRFALFRRFQRYQSDKAWKATAQYVALAREHGLSPTQLALAYVNSRPFLTSNLIGATTLAQLEENLGSAEVVLSDDVLERLEAIHESLPNPCP